MIFWDTSAVVPLLVDEPRSKEVTGVLRGDPTMVVWWGTEIECRSALARRGREGMAQARVEQARGVLEALIPHWSEVLASAEVRWHAARALRVHPLRAADALQLGAALTWAQARPTWHPFFTFDRSLREAARAEGFVTDPSG